MASFSRPSLSTVENILRDIYGQNVAQEEFRFYEVYSVVLNQILRALEGKGDLLEDICDEITLAPQYVLEREALIHPIDLYEYRKHLGDRLALKPNSPRKTSTRSNADELKEAENYLNETSMEVHLSDEEFEALEALNNIVHDGKLNMDKHGISTDSENNRVIITTESRIPDFLISHITSLSGRRILLIIEIKPDVPLTENHVVRLFEQAKLQASFAFEKFPAERTIYSLMLIGRKFHLNMFEKASCQVRHHLLKHVDEEPYSPRDKKRGKMRKKIEADTVPSRTWHHVFTETVTESGNRTTDIEIHGLTTEFKDAMDTVMKGVGRIQWGNC